MLQLCRSCVEEGRVGHGFPVWNMFLGYVSHVLLGKLCSLSHRIPATATILLLLFIIELLCWLLVTTVFWLFCYYSATILLLFFIIELLCWLLATTVLWLIDYSATIHTTILLLLFTIELLCWLFCHYSAYFANILTTLLLWQYRKGSHPMSLTMS